MEDKIEELQGDIATMELAIESLQEAIYYMSELDESMADFWQDDVDDLKRRIRKAEQEIEDLQEQGEYVSDNKERVKEFERENRT